MSRFSDIRAAMLGLVHTEDNQWNEDGSPRLAAVSAFCGFDVRQVEVNMFAVKRRQPMAPAPAPLPLPDVSVEHATERLAETTAAIVASRSNIQKLTKEVQTLRAAKIKANAEFQSGRPQITPSELIRDHLAGEVEHRRAVAAGEVQTPRPRFPSRLDAAAYYAKFGSSVDDGVGSASHRRGAMSRAQAMTATNLAKRAAKGV